MSKNINQLTSMGAFQSTDILHIWDASAAADRKATLAALLAALGCASATVSGLGSAATANIFKYATDGRKVGEGAGAGTGVIVRSSGSVWQRIDDATTVAA